MPDDTRVVVKCPHCGWRNTTADKCGSCGKSVFR